jgi:hypothetical protein
MCTKLCALPFVNITGEQMSVKIYQPHKNAQINIKQDDPDEDRPVK